MSAEKRLKELGLQVPPVTPPVANYVNAVRAGNLLFLAGKGGRIGPDGKRPQGKIGREYTVEQGAKAGLHANHDGKHDAGGGEHAEERVSSQPIHQGAPTSA